MLVDITNFESEAHGHFNFKFVFIILSNMLNLSILLIFLSTKGGYFLTTLAAIAIVYKGVSVVVSAFDSCL